VSPEERERLVSWLWNVSVMTGDDVDGGEEKVPSKVPRRDKRRNRRKNNESIWGILESYNPAGHIPPTPMPPNNRLPLPPVDEDGGVVEDEDHPPGSYPQEPDENGFMDGSSVMLYSPILPGQRDLVQVGEMVDVFVEEELGSDWDEEETAVGSDPETKSVAVASLRSHIAQPKKKQEDTGVFGFRRATAMVWQPFAAFFGGGSSEAEAVVASPAPSAHLRVPSSPVMGGLRSVGSPAVPGGCLFSRFSFS
jgi:hypothetical protein